MVEPRVGRSPGEALRGAGRGIGVKEQRVNSDGASGAYESESELHVDVERGETQRLFSRFDLPQALNCFQWPNEYLMNARNYVSAAVCVHVENPV